MAKAKVSIEQLLGAKVWDISVPYGDAELDVRVVDPKSPAVIIQYHEQREDAKFGEDVAVRNLWRECRVEPAALIEHYGDVPTEVKVYLTQEILDRLGEAHFFKQRSKLVQDALAKALTFPAADASSSKSLPTSESPQRPSQIAPAEIRSA